MDPKGLSMRQNKHTDKLYGIFLSLEQDSEVVGQPEVEPSDSPPPIQIGF